MKPKLTKPEITTAGALPHEPTATISFYLHVGDTVSCGHCNSKITSFPEDYGMKCDCKCHPNNKREECCEACEGVYYKDELKRITFECDTCPCHSEKKEETIGFKGENNRKWYMRGVAEQNERIIKLIEEMKGKYAWAADHPEGIAQDETYDEAIDEVITKIQSL